MKLTKLFCLFVLVCLFACGGETVTLTPYEPDSHWDTAAAEAQGLDSGKLSTVLTLIEAGRFGEIHSLLIARNDSLVIEEYFRGYDRSRLHQVYSVTKSVTSALIGIALEKGDIAGIDSKLLDFFPGYTNIAHHNALKDSIRLRDVLTMSAGLTWDEWSTFYGDDRNDATRLSRSNDWIAHVLDLPTQAARGTRFTHNSGCTMLPSAI